MGKLIVEHQENIGIITEIDVAGGPKVTCKVTNGGSSEPIDLPNGQHTVTITRIVGGNPVTVKVTVDIFDGAVTIITLGPPKGVSVRTVSP